MTKQSTGYEMTDADIEVTLKYLQLTVDKLATREDAIAYLEEHQSLAHVTAHKIVENDLDQD